jgi:S1-C subfamily serine protease
VDRKPDVAPFARVRVRETAADTYEISGAELNDALDHGGRVLAQEWPSVQPLLSIRDGIGLQVKSPVADGLLTRPGFQVTSPNLAARFGIQAGDLIVAINDQAVNSFGSLYNLYQQAVKSPLRSELQVRLERGGVPVTKTYRIR